MINDTLTVRYYAAPYGRMREIEMSNIYLKEIKFFQENDIVVSLEEMRGEVIVYACPRSDESEESEVMVFAQGRSCEDTMQDLRAKCEKAFL